MLLTYNGRSPVNIFYVFFFFIFLQFIGSLFLLFTFGFFNKNPIFIFFKKMFLKLLSMLGVMEELVTDELMRKEFLLNGILFSLGGILAIVLKVFFSDVVFGWSSSVNISVESIKSIIDFISIPWVWFWKSAVPSFDLIKESNYFRVNSKFYLDEIRSMQQIKSLGQWWEFFVASIVFYGILPRLISWLFLILRPSKVKKKFKKSFFNFQSQEVLDLFKLDEDETNFFQSVAYLLIENDVRFEKDKELKIKKEKWLKKFDIEFKKNEKQVRYNFEEVSSLLRSRIPRKSIKNLVMFCELLTFESYDSVKDRKVKFNDKQGLNYLSRLISLNDIESSTLIDFSDRLQVNIQENTPSGILKSWFGVALLSGAAIALTGGVGLAAVKIFSIMGIAARTAGLVQIGGGLLNFLGFEEEKNLIVMGSGNILGGLKESFDELVYEKYLKTDSIVLRDLSKLETYIEYKFFDEELFEKLRPSIVNHLNNLKNDILGFKSTHSIHVSKYINSLINSL